MEQKQFVGFILGKEEYGIDIMDVREVIDYREITKIPQLPESIEGVIDLRGDVIPIIDLRKKFKIEPKKGEEKILIAKLDDRIIGLVVDAVTEVFQIEKILTPPKTIKAVAKEYLTGVAKKDDKLILVIDVKKILEDFEKKAIEEGVPIK